MEKQIYIYKVCLLNGIKPVCCELKWSFFAKTDQHLIAGVKSMQRMEKGLNLWTLANNSKSRRDAGNDSVNTKEWEAPWIIPRMPFLIQDRLHWMEPLHTVTHAVPVTRWGNSHKSKPRMQDSTTGWSQIGFCLQTKGSRQSWAQHSRFLYGRPDNLTYVLVVLWGWEQLYNRFWQASYLPLRMHQHYPFHMRHQALIFFLVSQ